MAWLTPGIPDNLEGKASEAGIHAPNYRLPASAHVGKVRLAVSELELSIRFYSKVIGLRVIGREGQLARLGSQGSDQVLLELEEVEGVQAVGSRSGGVSRLGLYHTAFLLPSREDLSSFVQHLRKIGIRFGAGDHLYSEAIYLADPDGLQVEVYADRPRESWVFEAGELIGGTEAVRFDELPHVPEDSWKGAPTGTMVGHMHFYVGDLQVASEFYHAALGLDIMTWRFPGALFTSAGGYHHHVGFNVWAAGSPVAGKEDARLLFWELVLPDEEDVTRAAASMVAAGYTETVALNAKRTFSDPWGITVALVASK